MSRAKRIVTDGTGPVVLGTNCLSAMATCPFVVLTDDTVTVRAVGDEVATVDLLALSTRLRVRVTEDGIVVRTPGLVGRAEDVPTCRTRLAVLGTKGLFTRVTRLCVCLAGDRVTDGTLYPVRFTDLVATGRTRFEMIRTERIVT